MTNNHQPTIKQPCINHIPTTDGVFGITDCLKCGKILRPTNNQPPKTTNLTSNNQPQTNKKGRIDKGLSFGLSVFNLLVGSVVYPSELTEKELSRGEF